MDDEMVDRIIAAVLIIGILALVIGVAISDMGRV